jgi:PKD repeat protein
MQKKAFSAINGLYQNVENDLYGKIRQKGFFIQTKNANSLFYEKTAKSNARTEVVEVTSIFPITATAGTRTKMTITGSGFGANRGTNGNVLFADASTGGTTFRGVFTAGNNQPELISWSDTKIELYIPSFAGTGSISVVNNAREEFRTIDQLTITYALNTLAQGNTPPNAPGQPAVSNPATNPDLVESNGKGGYTMFISPDFFENRAILALLSNALTTWRCSTGVNIEMSELQSPINLGAQGISSVIIVGNIPGGALANVFYTYNTCNIGAGNNWRLTEFQMVINLQALQRQNIDLTTQFLFLLGRASQLNFVNDPRDLMYFRLNAGERKTIGKNNTDAISQLLRQSNMPNDCGTQPMQAVTAANCNNSIQAPQARFLSNVTALCDNGTVNFTDQSRNAVTLQWTFQGGNPATSTEKNPRVTYNAPGKYTVSMTVTNPAGMNTLTQMGYITVGKSGDLRVSLKDTVVCQGTTVRLNAGSVEGATYLWSNGANTPTLDVRREGTYTVTVTKDGCSATGSAKVSFANSPASAGQGLLLCVGQSGRLNATGGTAYRWTPTAGLSDPNVQNPTVRPSRTTIYYVAINTGGICGTIRDSVLVSVVAPPELDLPDTTTFCGTTNGILTYTPNFGGGIGGGFGGQDGVTYRWNTGATTPFLNVNRAGKYIITATNREGCIARDSTEVKFVTALRAVVSPNVTICQGGSTILNASGGQIYNWQPMTGLSDPNIPNPVANPTMTTTYTVTVGVGGGGGGPGGGGQGCQPVTARVTVTVVPRPTLNLGGTITTCDTALVLDTRIQGATYLWSDGSRGQTLRVRRSGVYRVTVTPPICNTPLIDSVRVNFVTLDLGKTVISCERAIILDTKIPNATYLWSDGSRGQTLRITRSGKYKVNVTLQGCSRTLTDSVNVYLPDVNIRPNGRDTIRVCAPFYVLDAGNVVPNVDYTWSDGSKNQTLRVTREGRYKVTVNRRDCNAILTDSIYITFFNVNLGRNITTCEASVTLNAGNPGARYSWSDAQRSTTRLLRVTTSGTYTVTVVDTCGATATSSINVVFNRLRANITSDTLLACQNPFTLDAGNRGVAASYAWNDGSRNQTLNITREGAYSVIVTDSCRNQITNRVFVTFTKPTLNLPDTLRSCTDSLIINTRIPQGGNAFTWSDGSTLPRLRVNAAGRYFVSVRTVCGDILRDTVTALFNRPPRPDFTFQISSSQGGSVVFTNLSISDTEDRFLWEFGDGRTSTDRNPVYIFQQIGTFNVTLTIQSRFCGNPVRITKPVNIIVAGVNSNTFASRVSVYPNPSESSVFTIKHSLNGNFKMRIIDMVGKTWEIPDLTATEGKLDLSLLPKGVYLLEMQNTQYKVVKKLVLQ